MICRQSGWRRVLFVTDRGLATQKFIVEAIDSCREAGLDIDVFSDFQGNPKGADVSAGVAALRERGCDGVVAVGGGAAIDVGKAIALMAGQSRPLWDFEDRADWYRRVDESAMVPLIAAPTTAGTGSEVGRASVIIDESVQSKKIIFHPRMLPGVVIADPELTRSLPRDITAWTGMDALSHNLEAFLAPTFHPMADGIAMQGIRLIKDSLVAAVRDGDDLQARSHMMVASSMGETAFQKGLGAMHALSHPIGSLFDTHHGLTNAVVMPYVIAFNAPEVETRLADLARYLDLAKPTASGFLDWVIELRAQLDIPQTLADIGLDDRATEQVATMSVADPSAATNPRRLDLPAATNLFTAALAGDLR